MSEKSLEQVAIVDDGFMWVDNQFAKENGILDCKPTNFADKDADVSLVRLSDVGDRELSLACEIEQICLSLIGEINELKQRSHNAEDCIEQLEHHHMQFLEVRDKLQEFTQKGENAEKQS